MSSSPRLKVMTIVGTRPELIKLSLVIPELDRSFTHVLVHTGQNYDYELSEVFFKDLGIRKPNHFLSCAEATAVQTIAKVLVRSEEVILQEKPDALLVYGDTNSCIAVLAAKKLKVPIFHMEAGNRCFDERVPEEVNRRLIDHLSDVNMPLTEHARRYLLAEGLPADRVLKTGSCMFEVLNHFAGQIDGSGVLARLKLARGEFMLVSAHREENVDTPATLQALLDSLSYLAKHFGKKVIFSVHPRTKKRIEALGGVAADGAVLFMEPLGFFDYIKLQKEAFCVLSDSGTLMEESAILNFPAVHCRQAFERPEGMELGTLVISDIEPSRLAAAVESVTRFVAITSPGATGLRQPIPPDYAIDGVSRTVARIIQSYTSMINRVVWHRY